MVDRDTFPPDDAGHGAGPRLYRDLAHLFPLLTPVEDYAEEAAFHLRLFREHCRRPPRTLLDLGSGGGHNAAHLKRALACTLVDVAPAMLAMSSRLNPDCEHVLGDMRSVRLCRTFDCVLVHDAVCYMTTRADLSAAIATAFAHTAPGGVTLFLPDYVRETFRPGTETGGGEADGMALRYLEWTWMPDPAADAYVADMAYMVRDRAGAVEVHHERHTMGLFRRDEWLALIAGAGFEPLRVPFQHAQTCDAGHDVFIGRRPAAE